MKMARCVWFFICVPLVHALNYGIPDNWRDYIAADMIDEHEGNAITKSLPDKFQGDISGVDPDIPDESLKEGLNNFVDVKKKMWPNGVVPYKMSDIFRQEDRVHEAVVIRRAMDMISAAASCIQFVEQTNEDDFLFIVRGFGCSSSVGRQTGRQTVELGVGCLENLGTIQHELMHSLGFYHEISRSDRDDYIWINWDNVDDRFKKDFKIPTDATTFGFPYDYNSVMHYAYNAFALDESMPTIVPKQLHARIGQNIGLSQYDIIKLNKAYECPGAEWLVATVTDKPSEKNQLKLKLNLTVPEPSFVSGSKRIALGKEECKALNKKVNGCFMDGCNDVDQSLMKFYCNEEASSDDVKNYVKALPEKVTADAKLSLNLNTDKQITPDMLAPIVSQLAMLDLRNHENFNTDVLAEVELFNLIELRFYDCKEVIVTRKGMRNLRSLKALSFLYTTVASIERGALESLPSLSRLVLDFWMFPTVPAHRAHLQRFHCSPEYAWFRDFLEENGNLLQPRPKDNSEGWSLPKNETTTYFPVDCHDPALAQTVEPYKFSTNVHQKLKGGKYVLKCWTGYAGTGRKCGRLVTLADINDWDALCTAKYSECCVNGEDNSCHWQE